MTEKQWWSHCSQAQVIQIPIDEALWNLDSFLDTIHQN